MMVTAALGVSFAAVESTRSLLCSRMLGLLCAPGHGVFDASLSSRLSAGLRSLVHSNRQRCDNGAKECVDRLRGAEHCGDIRIQDHGDHTIFHAVGEPIGSSLRIVQAILSAHPVLCLARSFRAFVSLHSPGVPIVNTQACPSICMEFTPTIRLARPSTWSYVIIVML